MSELWLIMFYYVRELCFIMSGNYVLLCFRTDDGPGIMFYYVFRTDDGPGIMFYYVLRTDDGLGIMFYYVFGSFFMSGPAPLGPMIGHWA